MIEQGFEAAKQEVGLDEYEVRHLLARLALTHPPTVPEVLRWSRWRRRHQIHAQAAHYRRRLRKSTEVQLWY